eukprot:4875361-Prymnesium_polylepis.1
MVSIVQGTPDAGTPEAPKLDIDQRTAAENLLSELLAAGAGAADTLLVRALGEDSEVVRRTALQAGVNMVRGPGRDKSGALFGALEGVLDHPSPDGARAERVAAGVLQM